MQLVPFRSSGPAADQSAGLRILQIGQYTLRIEQDPEGSGSSRRGVESLQHSLNDRLDADLAALSLEAGSRDGASLQHVGRVVWQSGHLLAEFLLNEPPFEGWAGVKALDLGAGTGVVGIALGLGGASVVLTDLAHILPLTKRNVAMNSLKTAQCQVVGHIWGTVFQLEGFEPDVITGADLIYEPSSHKALLSSLSCLCSSHTLVFLSFRVRDPQDLSFKNKLEQQGFWVVDIEQDRIPDDFRQQELTRTSGASQSSLGSYHILVAQKLP